MPLATHLEVWNHVEEGGKGGGEAYGDSIRPALFLKRSSAALSVSQSKYGPSTVCRVLFSALGARRPRPPPRLPGAKIQRRDADSGAQRQPAAAPAAPLPRVLGCSGPLRLSLGPTVALAGTFLDWVWVGLPLPIREPGAGLLCLGALPAALLP